MKSLSYFFAAALLLSTSPLAAMIPTDEDLKGAPTLTMKAYNDYLKHSDNIFDRELINTEEYMDKPHNLKDKLDFNLESRDKFENRTLGYNISLCVLTPSLSNGGIFYTLTPSAEFKAEENKKPLIFATLQKLVFKAKSKPLIEKEEITNVELPADVTSLKLKPVRYSQSALRNCTQLAVLDMSVATSYPDISHLTNLEELILGPAATGFLIPFLSKLTDLDLSNSSGLPASDSLHGLPSLQRVNIGNSRAFGGEKGRNELERLRMKNIEITSYD